MGEVMRTAIAGTGQGSPAACFWSEQSRIALLRHSQPWDVYVRYNAACEVSEYKQRALPADMSEADTCIGCWSPVVPGRRGQ